MKVLLHPLGWLMGPSWLVFLPWPWFGVICHFSCASASSLTIFSKHSKCICQILMHPFSIPRMESHEWVTLILIQVGLGGIWVILVWFESPQWIWNSLGNLNGYISDSNWLYFTLILSLWSLQCDRMLSYGKTCSWVGDALCYIKFSASSDIGCFPSMKYSTLE